MRTVRLYGELGKRFGDVFKLDVSSPAESIRALCAILKGFEKYLIESEKENVGFKVYDSETLISEKEFVIMGRGEIKIVPVIGGANGEARVLIGAALIAASFAMAAVPGLQAAAPYVMNAGIALAIGGAISMLIGPPKGPDIKENPGNKPSYLFGGAVNTTAQGQAIPLGYGRLIVGSAVISAALSTKSIMAGYQRVKHTMTQDITAHLYPDNYEATPPSTYDSKELLNSGTDTTGPFWIWRFTYSTYLLELVPV